MGCWGGFFFFISTSASEMRGACNASGNAAVARWRADTSDGAKMFPQCSRNWRLNVASVLINPLTREQVINSIVLQDVIAYRVSALQAK